MTRKGFGHEPIYLNLKDNCWYFWDEIYADSCGPFNSLQEAEEQLEEYCEGLLFRRVL